MKLFYSILLNFLLLYSCFAQETKFHAVHGIKKKRICHTVAHNQILFQKDPTYRTFVEALRTPDKNVGSNAKTSTTGVITIPVVVHVIHSGESVGSGTNISDAQISSQIDVLNEDFRRQNADTTNTPAGFQPVAGDAEIEFQLATLDPNGIATTGITRTQTSSAPFNPNFDNMKSTTTDGVDVWDRNKYLNIWVCDLGSSGVQGYAQFPGGDAATDGVVVDYRYVGRGGITTAPYDLGRPTVHEVGHWLGLYHIWGDGDCTDDDGIADTPNCDDEYYADNASGCINPGEQCSGAGIRMIQNYMDYSDDGCMNMFTQGQVTRMKNTLDGFRLSLQSSNGLGSSSDPPNTNFTSNKTMINENGNVQFTSLAAGATQWNWSFEGGNPASSTDENPIVNYTTPGFYDVTLTAGNINGDSTITRTDYIEVIEGPECYLYTDNYNNGTNTIWTDGAGYIVGHNTFSDKAKAEFYTLPAPYDQVASTKYFFAAANNTTPGRKIVCKIWDGSTGEPGTELASKDLLLSEVVTDVNNSDTTTITWDSPVNVTDDFFVGFTLDYAGSLADNHVGLFANDDGETVPSTAWEQASNNTWLQFNDNSLSWGLNVSLAIFPVMKIGAITGLENQDKVIGINIYPNPAREIVNIESFESNSLKSIKLLDPLGQSLIEFDNITSNKVSINTSELNDGIYLLQINTELGPITKRLVVR